MLWNTAVVRSISYRSISSGNRRLAVTVVVLPVLKVVVVTVVIEAKVLMQ